MKGQWNDKIFNVSRENFTALAVESFQFQYASNPVYREFTDNLHIHPSSVNAIERIPFLPITLFKSHIIRSFDSKPHAVFESSGTTGALTSRHYVADTALYRQSFNTAFELFYGSPADWCILGLLPSYLERQQSSLVFMVNDLIGQSRNAASGFYLDEFEKLRETLLMLEAQQQKTLLIGVTFALLDFAAYCKARDTVPFQHIIIMETGGMKGRREELLRTQVHEIIKDAFGVPQVHSEYGMTELLSQAYSAGEGIFRSPPWMRVLIRDEEDPLHLQQAGENRTHGVVNIIDLANIHSCCFIATDDTGKLFPDGSFEITGRLDSSDLRGCSLMAV